MSEDIDGLISSMKSQFEQMRTEYTEKLIQIEAQFTNEREGILRRNKAEVDQLFNDHKEVETHYLKKRQELEEENARDLEDVMRQDANKQAE